MRTSRRTAAVRQVSLGVDPISRGCCGASSGSPSHTSTSAASTSAVARATPIASTSSLCLAQAGRVGQQYRHAAERQRHLDMIARGPRNIGDDRSLLPAIALIRLDFPAFGGPATTTRTPSFSGSMRGPLEPLPQVRRPSAAQSPTSAGSTASILLVIVDRPLGAAPTGRAARSCQVSICLRKPALGERQRRLALRFGLGLDQVGEAFRLGQVDPAVLERAAGELARLRPVAGPRSTPSAASTASTTARPPWHWNSTISSPVELAGAIEPQDQRLVEQLAAIADAEARAPPPCAASGKRARDALASVHARAAR